MLTKLLDALAWLFCPCVHTLKFTELLPAPEGKIVASYRCLDCGKMRKASSLW